MFLVHNNLSSVISIRFHDPYALAIDFIQVIISVILFTVLFANQIMIWFTSAEHVPLVLSCLLNPSALATVFKQVIAPVICFLVIRFLPCLLTRYWFVSCQQHLCHRFCLLCIYDVLADLNRSLFLFYCLWHCLLTRHWFVQCSSTCILELSCSIILVQRCSIWTSHLFNTFIFQLGTVYLHHFR